jgi:hypothetical protein
VAHDSSLHTAFRTPEFWRWYTFDDTDGFDLDAAGERYAEELGEPELAFPARADWFLSMHLCFEVNLHTLYLCDLEIPDGSDDSELDVSRRLELGHWDEARWHPYCLRWEELEAVVQRMRAAPDAQQIPPDIAMLLLAHWVGHGGDEQALLDERRRILATVVERLGLFHGDEAARIAARLLSPAPEDDYAWRWDDESGWSLVGQYGCYTNRNEGHGFPFTEFAEFRQQLGVADEPAPAH